MHLKLIVLIFFSAAAEQIGNSEESNRLHTLLTKPESAAETGKYGFEDGC